MTENVEQAIRRYDIEHPVVQDNNFSIWKSYAIQVWPTLVFIGPDGYLLGNQPGEPDPNMLEMSLVYLLEDLERKGKLHGDAREFLKLNTSQQDIALRYPGKIAFSEKENEFAIADTNHNQIVPADMDGSITRQIGNANPGFVDGRFDSAEFDHPQGLCYQNGIVWVADTKIIRSRKKFQPW